MDLVSLIEGLSNAASYPYAVDAVEVRHTHISAVFLAGDYVYKVKKPVNFGFLDFTTLEKRRHFCEEEVRLNRRLAASVYLGVVPVARQGEALRVESNGEIVEWAVKMKRLPEDSTLLRRLRRDDAGVEHTRKLAQKLAAFHARADAWKGIEAFGRFAVVARNARENFEQAAQNVGVTLSQAVFDRLRELNEDVLVRLRPVMERRAERGVPRDTHGDLHLDHIYIFPDRPAPDNLVIIDCIEFNERFRFADPVSDMAFLVMDLRFRGRRDLSDVFADEYFRATADEEGRSLLSFYVAYRAAVRGKVEGIELSRPEISESERSDALVQAKGHWLLALGELETPTDKPCLVLIGGLPGAGKSTLAQALAARANFVAIRSDVVRKELAGVSTHDSARCSFGEGIYAADWTERTYGECLRRAERLVFEGKRVIVDASFGEHRQRRAFVDAAARLSVPAILIVCRAEPELARQRLESRRGDASDADWSIYRSAAERWEPVQSLMQCAFLEVSTSDTVEGSLAQALGVLRDSALLS
jgi:aminoglycoside phosphotransferase family enzyme/predicted kinase